MTDAEHRDHPVLDSAYERLLGEEDARVCKDIPTAACQHQPVNFFGYLIANTVGKVADELSSARLILPWILSALGAPAALVGFLVPVREAGVLLPQLVVAAWVRSMPVRKPVWLWGAALSGLALLLMGWVALTFTGTLAGVLIVASLVVYSLARGLCSVSAKDVLGKTVSKQKRGTLMGYASSVSGALLMLWGVVLLFGSDWQSEQGWLAALLIFSGALWFSGVLAFRRIVEAPGSTEGGGNALTVALKSLSVLVSDARFRRFVMARALLLGIALAAPFFVVLLQQAGGSMADLGALIVLNGLAALISAPFWGRWSDRSSRRVMQVAALLGAVLIIGVAVIASRHPDWLTGLPWLMPLAFFLLTISHNGVRLGRKAYLVDMADSDTRATFVAVSNTVIGILMLLGGLIGWIGDVLGLSWVLTILGMLSLGAVLLLQAAPEVTRD